MSAVARVLDDLVEVPGTGRRFGLEPVIGLVPIAGDVVSAAVAGWVVLEGARAGVPRVVLVRMVVNVLLDLVVGAIPLVGDLADFGLKANTRNVALFRRHALDPDASTSGSRAFLLGLVAVVIGAIWLALLLLERLLNALS